MALIERIADMLGGRNREVVRRNSGSITEIRLRSGRALRLSLLNGCEAEGEKLEARALQNIVNHLMDNSLYSRENELRHGYFTTMEGFRVGVCGKVNAGRDGIDRLVNIGSACIRIPREIRGTAEGITQHACQTGKFNMLIVSPPGLGKTTMLRDYIRLMSERGVNIGLADERREIACCLEGIPQLEVGCRTDVMDGCPKALALSMMIRSSAPDLVAVDEIGTVDDAQAILEASHCGVSVAATAHGSTLDDLVGRKGMNILLREGVFDWCVFLGPGRGQVGRILPLHEGADEKVYDAQRNTAGVDPARLFLRGEDALQCAQEKV